MTFVNNPTMNMDVQIFVWVSAFNSLAYIPQNGISESVSAWSCPVLCDTMDCSLPGSSIPGTFQARILEQNTVPFSKGPF